MNVQNWINSRTKKIRHYPFGTLVKPSTAEIRRWLRAKTTPKEVKNHIYQWLLYRRHALSIVMFFVLVALAALEAAGRPFVLTSVLGGKHCVMKRCGYEFGAFEITTSDPTMKAHLDSFIGKKVVIVVEED